jgi:hypothetical protein
MLTPFHPGILTLKAPAPLQRWNLSKPAGVGAASQRLIPTGERSGLLNAHRGDGKRFVASDYSVM